MRVMRACMMSSDFRGTVYNDVNYRGEWYTRAARERQFLGALGWRDGKIDFERAGLSSLRDRKMNFQEVAMSYICRVIMVWA